MARTTRRLVGAAAAFVVAAALLAACGGATEEPTPDDGEMTTIHVEPTDEPSDDPTTEPTTSGPLDDRSQAAVDDLAERLGIDAALITAAPLEDVTWTDGSIGCPQPGQQYTQALVPGVRLILTVGTAVYAYHGKGSEPLFYCENPTAPAPAETA